MVSKSPIRCDGRIRAGPTWFVEHHASLLRIHPNQDDVLIHHTDPLSSSGDQWKEVTTERPSFLIGREIIPQPRHRTIECFAWSHSHSGASHGQCLLDSPPLEMMGLGWMMSNPHRPSTGHGWGTHHRPQTMLWSGSGLHHDLPNSSVGSDRSSRRGRDAQVHALWAVPCILSSTCHHPRGLKDDTYRRRRTHRTGGDCGNS